MKVKFFHTIFFFSKWEFYTWLNWVSGHTESTKFFIFFFSNFNEFFSIFFSQKNFHWSTFKKNYSYRNGVRWESWSWWWIMTTKIGFINHFGFLIIFLSLFFQLNPITFQTKFHSWKFCREKFSYSSSVAAFTSLHASRRFGDDLKLKTFSRANFHIFLLLLRSSLRARRRIIFPKINVWVENEGKGSRIFHMNAWWKHDNQAHAYRSHFFSSMFIFRFSRSLEKISTLKRIWENNNNTNFKFESLTYYSSSFSFIFKRFRFIQKAWQTVYSWRHTKNLLRWWSHVSWNKNSSFSRKITLWFLIIAIFVLFACLSQHLNRVFEISLIWFEKY